MKLSHIISAAVLVSACVCTTTANAQRYGDEYRDDSAFAKMTQKLGRGVANIFTGVVEVPKNISSEWRKSDPVTGFFVGGAKGIGWWGARTAVGIYDTVTFPMPVPANYEPLMEPAYPLADQWGKQLPYFDKTY
ncbi:exosortase system-associated protein, TIGR04073 family [Candidatus Sumerlaeota bacterium]|nr:exosortase system-associated protein, TIGR04073 family [Candidatus Sumerlaeales bacterium]NLD62247.1 exosortase system-associated protein, TIGR04073 family [Candidatus Sumerlaeota bacterium]